VATQILALDGNGNVEHYNGDYTEYHDWKAARLKGGPTQVEAEQADSSRAVKVTPAGAGGARSGKNTSARSASSRGKGKSSAGRQANAASRIKVIKKPRDPDAIETEVSALEKRLVELSAEMTKPEVARDIGKLVKLNDEYQQGEARLAELLDEWERAEATAGSSKR